MTQRETVLLDGELYLDLQMDGELETDLQMDGEIGIVTRIREYSTPIYDGTTEITPSEDTQILQTADKTVLENIVINPIPANYGRIIYDGTHLRIE